MRIVSKNMPPEAIEIVKGLFPKAKVIDDQVYEDDYHVYMSPKQLGLLGLPTTIEHSGQPVPNGWCLPDMKEVLKGNYIGSFEKSVNRIAYSVNRKDAPVRIIKSIDKLILALDKMINTDTPFITIDLETKTLSPTYKDGEIVSIAITNAKETIAFPWRHRDSFITAQYKNPVIGRLRTLMTKHPIACHNAKYEIKWLWDKFRIWPKLAHDTMLYAYLVDENSSTALSELVWKHFPAYAGYEGYTTGIEDYSLIPIRHLLQYNGTDTYLTYALVHILKKLVQDEDVQRVWEQVLKPITPHLAKMELAGFNIDKDEYNKTLQWYHEFIAKTEKQILNEPEIRKFTKILKDEKKKINFRSYDQRKRLLFHISGIKPEKRLSTKHGNPSTNADAIEWYADKYPDIKWLSKLRVLNKAEGIMSAFLKDRIPMLEEHKDGRIHTNFNTHLVVSGRLSSTDPNQQNLPRDADLHDAGLKSIKKMYNSRFDRGFILSADYSQVEMRIATALSNDESFIKAYRNHEDVHAQTATLVFGKKFTKAQRTKAKTMNFSILNDISARELAIDLLEEEKTAKEYIRMFFDAHPQLRQFMLDCHNFVLKHGYIKTPLGRKRRFIKELSKPDISSYEVQHICRQAANFPIQSLASDTTLRTIAILSEKMMENKLHSVIIGTVHDSIIIDCFEPELESIVTTLQAIVEKFEFYTGWDWLRGIPLEIDISIGFNLSEQEEV